MISRYLPTDVVALYVCFDGGVYGNEDFLFGAERNLRSNAAEIPHT